MLRQLSGVSGAVACACLLAVSSLAQAATFNQAYVITNATGVELLRSVDGVPTSVHHEYDGPVPVYLGPGAPLERGAKIEAMAEASVAGGLKTKASVDLHFDQSVPTTAQAPTFVAYGIAMTGDSFIAQNQAGGSYDWSADDEVTLKFDISGLISQNVDNITGGSSSPRNNLGQTMLRVLAFDSGYLQQVEDENQQASDSDAFFQDQWHLGMYLFPPDMTNPVSNHLVLTDDGFGYLEITFKPGQDFDLVIQLFSHVEVNPTTAYGILEHDFSHTVTFSIQGPQGAVLTSSSGDFNIVGPPVAPSVPEPVSASLLAMGSVMLIGAINRRRR